MSDNPFGFPTELAPEPIKPFNSVFVRFRSAVDEAAFARVIEQRVVKGERKRLWFPRPADGSEAQATREDLRDGDEFYAEVTRDGVRFDLQTADWLGEWTGMPEFISKEVAPYSAVLVQFATETAQAEFSRRVEQPIDKGKEAKSIWFPKLPPDAEVCIQSSKRYSEANDAHTSPTYPIYIISKGRWERPMTARSLEEMRVPYKIVVEPQEYFNYASTIDEENILTLPFSNLGLGGIPARNWVWEHAKASGAKRHWILDDNIGNFYRWNNNKHTQVTTGAIFKAAEDFVDRYDNVPMAGMNYRWLCKAIQKVPAFYKNTRCYSCILLQNDVTERWRGRYNEDTDLSLQFMSKGKATILFNAFLCGKASTMQMKGGNTDELYKGDGRLKMAEELVANWPGIATVSHKFNRAQHHVDYSRFLKNQLSLSDFVRPEGINNYGMVLTDAPEKSR